ncbi:disease resistance protein, partial [Striga asiatica]
MFFRILPFIPFLIPFPIILHTTGLIIIINMFVQTPITFRNLPFISFLIPFHLGWLKIVLHVIALHQASASHLLYHPNSHSKTENYSPHHSPYSIVHQSDLSPQ